MGIVYVRYSTETGEILGTGDCSNEEQCLIQMDDSENEHVVFGVKANDATQWVDEEGNVVDRPQLTVEDEYTIAADGEAEVTFPLPEGTSVRWDGGVSVADDGLRFRTNKAGVYEFHLRPPFPFIPKTVTITAQ
jgi:hypothetical protein